MRITSPFKRKPGLTGLQRFWTELGFWVTIIVTFKNWLKYQAHLDSSKGRVTINGVTYYVRDIKIIDGHIYLDGEYVCPTEIKCLTCKSDPAPSRNSNPSSLL